MNLTFSFEIENFRVNYREKWDRILAAFTAVLAFTLLVAYVIVSSVNERKPPSEVDDDDSIIALWVSTKATPASRNLDGGSKCQLQDECGITCTNFIGSDNITEHINAVAKDVNNVKAMKRMQCLHNSPFSSHAMLYIHFGLWQG